MSLRDRIAARLWGYDFFISYQWSTGGKYAMALAARLRERGLDCFLDRAEFAAGDDWKIEARRALDRTQRLVVVANPEAMRESAAVRREVEIFTARNQRIVLITFDRPYTEDERKDIPTLAMISASCLSATETAPVTAGEPSKAVVDRLVQTHDLIRRKRLRRGIVAGVIATLSVMLAVSIVLGLGAYYAQQREKRARLGEEARRLVEVAHRQRGERGPTLDDSLASARAAYLAARAGGKDTAGAAAAIEAALALTPEPLGAPWTPPSLGGPDDYRLEVEGSSVVLRLRDVVGDPYAMVARFDAAARAWSEVRRFDAATSQGFIALPGPRWLVTGPDERPRVWDVTTGAVRELPFAHSGELHAPSRFLALSADGDVALSAAGDALVTWRLDAAPPVRTDVGAEVGFGHHLSPSGRWIIVEADGGTALRFVDTTDPKNARTFELVRGGGHLHVAAVVGDAVVAWWENNQVAMTAGGPRGSLPNSQSAVWNLGSFEVTQQDGVLRADAQELAYAPVSAEGNPALAVLGDGEPAIILDLESRVSLILGTPELAGDTGTFSPDGLRFLCLHADGTARLWDLSRPAREVLRYAPETPLAQAAFLSPDIVLTRDTAGALQAWTTTRTTRTVEQVVAGP
jgi:hypothetical protein